MKIQNKKLSKKVIIIIITIIVLVVGAASAGAYYLAKKDSDTTKQSGPTNYNKPTTDEQKESGESIKEGSVNPNPSQSPVTKPNSDAPTTPSSPSPSPDSVQVDITAASQNNSTGIYQIRALIHSVQGEGTCRLTLIKGSAQVIKEVSVQPLASSSTCRGFDIPLTELSAGQWQANLTFTNTKISGATSRTITVQ